MIMSKKYQLETVPRMFEEVIRQIIFYMQDEELKKGDKLPPERKLSELLEVSRSSVREGLRILELLRYLESRQGGGTFVSEPPPFLIPMTITQNQTDSKELNKYFDIALMNAEKIIFTSLKQDTSISLQSGKTEDFWKEFSGWINELGKQLSNEYYISIWNNIYALLTNHHFFQTVTSPLKLDDLKIAFYKKDQQTLQEFFQSFQEQSNSVDGINEDGSYDEHR
ncbi:FadR/GntR family transcriptional regulator [Thalassobacillus devorans]|uniref:FadR/GntR family transcriptional regulator n=1 Tax=Thalassobacillus devorans TaxID=279813 RepID=UPI0004B6ECC0|nr:GntR family transcriptional regulator [Thalassobacillus devorans]